MNAKQQYKTAYWLARRWHDLYRRNGLDYAWWYIIRLSDLDNIPLHLISHCIMVVGAYRSGTYHH